MTVVVSKNQLIFRRKSVEEKDRNTCQSFEKGTGC